ncbi:hypothetical protein BDR07DRAFT_1310575 [Suillus spraguei]|nr:hypothetical protein BDR07DRAFT_1310575 [Suillus spraguei]
MKTSLVSSVTFLSKLGIVDKPVFGLIVNVTLGAVTMAWMTNKQIYVMERNIRHYDIRDPLQALQFVSILPRLARHGLDLRGLLEKQLAIIDVNELQSKPWSKLPQRQEDKSIRKFTHSLTCPYADLFSLTHLSQNLFALSHIIHLAYLIFFECEIQ